MNTISRISQTLPVELLSAAEVPSYAKAMTRTVKISEAKVTLSKLADEVSLGKEVIVSRAGKPVMKLVALNPEEKATFQAQKLPRDLWITAKYFKDFDWDEWDRLDEEMHQMWRRFGYMA
jgi:antitoxin (DNA-binding transcriptional repressor) of toxin-antitoxin stability system